MRDVAAERREDAGGVWPCRARRLSLGAGREWRVVGGSGGDDRGNAAARVGARIGRSDTVSCARIRAQRRMTRCPHWRRQCDRLSVVCLFISWKLLMTVRAMLDWSARAPAPSQSSCASRTFVNALGLSPMLTPTGVSYAYVRRHVVSAVRASSGKRWWADGRRRTAAAGNEKWP